MPTNPQDALERHGVCTAKLPLEKEAGCLMMIAWNAVHSAVAKMQDEGAPEIG